MNRFDPMPPGGLPRRRGRPPKIRALAALAKADTAGQELTKPERSALTYAERRPERILTRYLIEELQRVLPNGIDRAKQIVDKLIQKAAEGDNIAIQYIWDRVEGKVPAPITGGDGGPVEINVRVIALGAVVDGS